MKIIRFRSAKGTEHLMHKLKKMNKFIDELIDCVSEMEEVDDDDDDFDYREDEERMRRSGGSRYAYRRGRM